MCCRFLGEKGKHINKIPRKSQKSAGTVPGLSRDNPVKIMFMCFVVYWFFSGPESYILGGFESPFLQNLATQKIAIAEKYRCVFKSQSTKSQVWPQKSQKIARKSQKKSQKIAEEIAEKSLAIFWAAG